MSRICIAALAALLSCACSASALTLEPVPGFQLPRGLSGPVTYLGTHDLGEGPVLIAGGQFLTADGVVVNGLAQWNGAQWSGVADGAEFRDDGASARIEAFALFDFGDGTGPNIVVGGDFDHVGDVEAFGIARFNGAAWRALDSGLTLEGEPGLCVVLAVGDVGHGPQLFAGGSFDHAGDTEVIGVAAWSEGGWASLGLTTEMIGPTDHRCPIHDLVIHRVAESSVLALASLKGAVRVWDGHVWAPMWGPRIGGPFPPGKPNLELAHDLYIAVENGSETIFVSGALWDLYPDVYSRPLPFRVGRWNGEKWVGVLQSEGFSIDRAVIPGDITRAVGVIDRQYRPYEAIFGDYPFGAMAPNDSFSNAFTFWGPSWHGARAPVELCTFPPDEPEAVMGTLTQPRSEHAPLSYVAARKKSGWTGLDGPDTTGGLGLNHTPSALAMHDGEIIVGGGISRAGSVDMFGAASLAADGWRFIGSELDTTDLALDVLAGVDLDGQRRLLMYEDRETLKTLDGYQWEDLRDSKGRVLSTGQGALPIVSYQNSAGRSAIVVGGNSLCSPDGTFQKSASLLFTFDGVDWAPVEFSFAEADVELDTVYVAYTISDLDGSLALYTTTYRRGDEWFMARVEDGAATLIPGAIDIWFADFPRELASARVGGRNVVIAWGGFRSVGGLSNTKSAAVWDGVSWSPLPGLDDETLEYTSRLEVVSIAGDDLLVHSGTYTTTDSDTGEIIRHSGTRVFDGESWLPKSGPFPITVNHAVATSDSGYWAIAITGYFQSVDGVPSSHIAVLRTDRLLGDMDGDGAIDRHDIAAHMQRWGTDDAGADFDFDGDVDVQDFVILVRNRAKGGRR